MTRARDVADNQENLGGGVPPFTAGKNGIINGAFGVWQRGTSLAVTSSSSSFYGPDRWQVYRGATGSTVSRQVTGDTTNLPSIQYCARVQRDSGNTSTSAINFIQNFESSTSIPFAGKRTTLSFYARAGANYSATGNGLVAVLNSGTGTDQNLVSVYTGVSTVVSGTATLTTTWQRFTFTGTVSASATELAVQIQSNPTGTAGAADYFEVTGVQLEAGNVATPFTTATGTVQGELAACQRYCYIVQGNSTNATTIGTGYWNGTTNVVGFLNPKTRMRATPTLTFSSVTDFRVLQVGVSYNNVSAIALAAENNADLSQISFTTTGGTNGQASNVIINATATAFIGLVAEL